MTTIKLSFVMNLNENVGGIIMKSRKMMHHNEHSNNRMIMGTNITKQRLESLDVLRGFDLFCLVALKASCIHWPMPSMLLGLITSCEFYPHGLGRTVALGPGDAPVYVHERCIHSVRLVALSKRSSQGTSI